MKTNKLLLVGAILSWFSICTALAQLNSQRNILLSYKAIITKRLIAAGEWKPFPTTASEWQQLVSHETQTRLIKKGEIALKKEFHAIPATVTLEFLRSGNRTDYEAMSFDKRYMLWDLVLAESVERKGRFTDHIIDGIWSICEESFWGINAHIGMQKAGNGLPDIQDPVVDLFAAETASILAWTDYLLGSSLAKQSPLIRQRIAYETNRRVLTPMVNAKYGYLGNGNPNAKLSNWAPWVASNYLTTVLLLEKDSTKRAAGVLKSIDIINQYINSLGDDGSTEEGPHYWFAAGACVFDALTLITDATNGSVNFFNNDFIRKIGQYIYQMQIAGNYFINVADAAPTLHTDGLLLFRFGCATNDDYLKSLGNSSYLKEKTDSTPHEEFYRTRQLYNLRAINDCKAYTSRCQPIKDVWFPNIELMATRLDNGLFIAAHGGNNGESHNHNDVGDFMIYADEYPVIIDIGRGTYTARTFSKNRYDIWFNTSAYHNLPIINGFQQAEGSRYSARNVQYNHKGLISHLSLDIAGAYPHEAGISSWIRSISVNKKRSITISDSYVAKVPLSQLQQSFMTVCETDLSQPGKIRFLLTKNKSVTLNYNPDTWKVTVEKACKGIPEEEGLKTSWQNKTIYRILLTAQKLPANGKTEYTIGF